MLHDVQCAHKKKELHTRPNKHQKRKCPPSLALALAIIQKLGKT
jgi:hypothetical protein